MKKNKRTWLLILILFFSTTLKSQHITSRTLLPANPTNTDVIRVALQTWFNSGSCFLTNHFITFSNNTFYLTAYYQTGIATVICDRSDTFFIANALPSGSYVLDITTYVGDPVSGSDHASLSFNVSGVVNPCTGVNTDDGNACTVDACNTSTGQITHTPYSYDVQASASDVNCFGGTTCVQVIGFGGVGFLAYSDGVNSSIDGIFCGYHAGGPYYFSAIDANGCVAYSNPVLISEPPKLNMDSTSSSPVSCGLNNGSAKVYPSGGTPPYSFLWSPGGQTTNPVANLGSGFYCVTVKDANHCPITACVTVGTSGSSPSTPGPISGLSGVCKNQSEVAYSVPAVSGSHYYRWTVPSKAILISGQGTTSIAVKLTDKYAGGFICVSDSNACGLSSPACKQVALLTARPSKPTISGPDPACAGSTVVYCAASLNATSFAWLLDHGLVLLSGQGTNCITVQVPVGYNGDGHLKVKGMNCKGISDQKDLRVRVTHPLQGSPQFCIANSNDNHVTVCAGSTNEYEICLLADAGCYNWTAPEGAIINDRNGHSGNPLSVCIGNLNDVLITFPPGFTTGQVSVSASNACGESAARVLSISGVPCRIAGSNVFSEHRLNAYPNPASRKMTIAFYSKENKAVSITLIDMLGKEIVTDVFPASEGENTRILDFEKVENGMYFLRLESGDSDSQLLKIIVEHQK